MQFSPQVLISTAVTVLGLLLLFRAVTSSPSSKSGVLGGISGYGEPGWGAAAPSPPPGGEDVVFEKRGSPIAQLLEGFRDSRRKQSQKSGLQVSEAARRLMLAQLPLDPIEWVVIRIGVCAGVGGLTFLRMGSPVIGAIVGVLGGFMITKIYLGRRIKKRQKKFEKQLLEVMAVIGAGMRAGSTFNQALDYVAAHVEAPAGPEFARLARETQLGVPMDECLSHLAERNESTELKLLVNALVVNRRVGGNQTSILDILGDTIRTRIKIKGEIQTLTAQARASAWIVSLLPLALLGILSMISPTYVKPLFTSGIGIGILIGAGVMMILGIFIMSAITKVDV